MSDPQDNSQFNNWPTTGSFNFPSDSFSFGSTFANQNSNSDDHNNEEEDNLSTIPNFTRPTTTTTSNQINTSFGFPTMSEFSMNNNNNNNNNYNSNVYKNNDEEDDDDDEEEEDNLSTIPNFTRPTTTTSNQINTSFGFSTINNNKSTTNITFGGSHGDQDGEENSERNDFGFDEEENNIPQRSGSKFYQTNNDSAHSLHSNVGTNGTHSDNGNFASHQVHSNINNNQSSMDRSNHDYIEPGIIELNQRFSIGETYLRGSFGPRAGRMTVFERIKFDKIYKVKPKNGESKVHIVGWDFIEGEELKYAFESHSVFVTLQKNAIELYKQLHDLQDKTTLLTKKGVSYGTSAGSSGIKMNTKLREASRCYRAVLCARIDNLRQSIISTSLSSSSIPPLSSSFNESTMKKNNQEKRDKIEALRAQEQIMHLCEIFYINTHLNVGPQLIQWIQQHKPSRDINIFKEMDSKKWYIEKKFWRMIYTLTFQGKTEQIIGLIKDFLDEKKQEFYPSKKNMEDGEIEFQEEEEEEEETNEEEEDTPYDFVEMLLSVMPKFQQREVAHGFLSKFQDWQKDCKEVLSSFQSTLDDQGASQLITILKIMSGDDTVIQNFKDISWYEILAFQVLYKNPIPTTSDIQEYAERAILNKNVGGFERISPYDCLIYGLMIPEELEESLSTFSGVFESSFIAHLTDILWHCGRISSYAATSKAIAANCDNLDLREQHLLNYVEHLMIDPSNWMVCLNYLTYCPRRGVDYALQIVERTAVNSEMILQKMTNFCREYKNRIGDIMTVYLPREELLNCRRELAALYRTYQDSLDDQIRNLHTIFAVSHVKQHKQYATGIRHMLLAEDTNRVTKIADQLLENYIESTRPTIDHPKSCNALKQLQAIAEAIECGYHARTTEAVTDMESRFISSVEQNNESTITGQNMAVVARSPANKLNYRVLIEKLAFIHKYVELLQALDQKKHVVAGRLILLLLTQQSTQRGFQRGTSPAPRRFWVILLMHSVCLLEQKQVLIFNREQTYLLMNCLEEICSSHRSDEYLRGISTKDLDVIRLALSRNLSRALIQSQQQLIQFNAKRQEQLGQRASMMAFE